MLITLQQEFLIIMNKNILRDTYSGLIPAANNEKGQALALLVPKQYVIDQNDAVLLVILSRFIALISFVIHLKRWFNEMFGDLAQEVDDFCRRFDSEFNGDYHDGALFARVVHSLKKHNLRLSHIEIIQLLKELKRRLNLRILRQSLTFCVQSLIPLHTLLCVFRL